MEAICETARRRPPDRDASKARPCRDRNDVGWIIGDRAAEDRFVVCRPSRHRIVLTGKCSPRTYFCRADRQLRSGPPQEAQRGAPPKAVRFSIRSRPGRSPRDVPPWRSRRDEWRPTPVRRPDQPPCRGIPAPLSFSLLPPGRQLPRDPQEEHVNQHAHRSPARERLVIVVMPIGVLSSIVPSSPASS
ncbi:MAG: hypothetical protein QOH05_412 [Acetobacteraceae bacterium]|nr:hypothetical protein [Acetobacteraceae bacterium]